MQINLNSPEHAKSVYTAYTGKVLGVDTHIGSSIQGGTTNSAITGKDLYITSSAVEIKKAKVVMPNGRMKEFTVEGVEMQEGDEVEFITDNLGKNIYIKNSTTGESNIAALSYTKSEVTPVVAVACLGAVGYGVYSIFWGKQSFLFGLLLLIGGAALLASMIKIRAAMIKNLESSFQTKVKATGLNVTTFKTAKEIF